MDRVNEEKEKGNDALKKKNYEKAIHHYTTALDLLGNIENQNEVDYILYSNRSAVRLIVHDYNGALEDALKCTALKPNWAKGYLRVVNAYLCLHDYTKAKEALKKGINASEKDESTTKLLSRARDITEYAQEHKSLGFERFAKLIIHKRYPLHTAIENIKKGDVLALLSLCVAVGSYVVPAQTMIQQGWIDTLIATLMSLPLHDMFLMENIIVALANITADYNYPPMRQRCTEDTFLNTIARLLDTSVQTKDVHLLDPILTLLVNISDDAVAAPRVAGNQTIWDRMVEVYTHPESFSNRSRSLARKAIYCLCFDQVGQLQLSKSSQEFTDFFINDCLHGSLQHPEDLPYLAQYMLVSNPEMYKRFLGQDFVDWLTSLTMKGNTTTLSSLGLMMRQDESLAFAKRVINTKLVKMLAKHAKSDNYDARTLAVEMLTFICVTNGYQLRDVLARMDIEEILSPLLQSRHRETKEVAQQAIKRFKLGTKQEEPTAPMCNFCKRYTTESKRCSACKSVRYCSVDCQKKDWPEHKKICASLKGDDNLQVSSKERDIDRTASKEYVFSHVAEINMLYATSEKSKAEAVTYIDMRFAPPKMVVVTLAELKLDGNERGPEYLHENVAKQMGKRTGGQIVVVVQNKSTVFAMTLAEPEFGEEMMDKFLESIIKH